jgi:16S rRNA (cytidine1402-2'-O)-methyltransferase
MGIVYLIPSLLHEDGVDALPAYLLEAATKCEVFFVENERTTRRYLKKLDSHFVIDDHEWINMDDPNARQLFRQKLKEGKNIGIISEAGCPGIADPGQLLVAIAQEMKATIKPLTGPNSLLLALMASGMNGQRFQFLGYLPIDTQERIKAIRDLENVSAKENSTQLFIETPYRNNQLLEALLKHCKSSTRLCLAVDLTAKTEWIKTQTVKDWQDQKPDIHKRPAIFLLEAAPLNPKERT